jgi:phage FluMu protein Com
MPESFSFRCVQCNKLLGVTVARVGTNVACPRCGTTQVVPEPPEDPPVAAVDPSPRRASAPGAAAPPVVEPPPRATPAAPAPAPAAEAEVGPIPGLVLDDDPLTLRPRESRPGKAAERSRVAPAPDLEEPSASVPVIAPGPAGAAAPSPPLAAAPGAIVAPSDRGLTLRRHDVILPRSALQLWSFLMLMGLVFAFTTGLLAGHFLWRSATPAAPAPAAAPK